MHSLTLSSCASSTPTQLWQKDQLLPVLLHFRLESVLKTFTDLENKLKEYEVATATKFWICDNRTVNAARKTFKTSIRSDQILPGVIQIYLWR